MNNNAKIEINEVYLYHLYKAKKTLWYFNSLIINNFSGYTAVKFKNESEVYIWMENIRVEGSYYLGKLSESDKQQKILIDEVIDWMLVENNRLIGGYTIRCYRDNLPDEEKVNFDIDFGLKIDNGNDFFYPDLTTPEGAIITLENYYTQKDIEGVLSCKDFCKEAKNILLETGHTLDEKVITETSELLKVALIEDLQKNGMPNFENLERVFNRLSKNIELNMQLIEEKLIYPDGKDIINKFWVAKDDNNWKVLNMVEQ